MIKEKSKTWAAISHRLGLFFTRLPFSPNTYSWLTILPALLGLFVIVEGFLITGILLFLTAGLLDLADGAVARHRDQATAAGAFLDGSLDRVVDFLLIFSYLWVAIETPWMSLAHWVAAAVFFALMPSFEVAYANHRQAVDDPQETIIWRILHRGEMYFLMLLVLLLAKFSAVWAGYCLVFLVILSAITTLQTFFTTLYLAKKKGSANEF